MCNIVPKYWLFPSFINHTTICSRMEALKIKICIQILYIKTWRLHQLSDFCMPTSDGVSYVKRTGSSTLSVFLTPGPLKILRWNFSSLNKTLGLFLGQKLDPTIGSAHAKKIQEYFGEVSDQCFKILKRYISFLG